MRKKEKGYILVFVFIVVAVLIVLATAVLQLSTSSFLITKKAEDNNKLKLAAESGIDRGGNILKYYISKHPNVFIEPQDFNPNDLNPNLGAADPYGCDIDGDGIADYNLKFTEDDIRCTIKFSPNTTPDDSKKPVIKDKVTGRSVQYVRITATAEKVQNMDKIDEKVLATKTVQTDIDKTEISNLYFDRLFKSCFTVGGNYVSNPPNNDVSFSLGGEADTAPSNVTLSTSGNIYIQGGKAVIKSSGSSIDKFKIASGNLYALVNNISFNGNISKDRNNLYKNKEAVVTANPSNAKISDTDWINANVMQISMLHITSNNSQDFNSDTDPYNHVDSKINIVAAKDSSTPTLITYKGKAKIGEAIDFNQLVDGKITDGKLDIDSKTALPKHGIYSTIVNTLLRGNINEYGNYYKFIMIDGDLDIEDDFLESNLTKDRENFNNYVIYCSGTVTFKGDAQFYNSSIFARKIIFNNDMPNTKVIFYGVDTAKASQHNVNGIQLKDFTLQDKGLVHEYLINNLENYVDYIQFKTLEWKEY